MNYFFTDNIQGNIGELTTEEAAHCFKVLRKKVDDIIYLLDGNGNEYQARITSISKRDLSFEIIESAFHKAPDWHFHLVVAPTKNMARIEWLLEKTTEVGISEITLVICDHSERKVVKEERLTKILIGAMKQSGNFYLPKLNSLVSIKDCLSSNFDGDRFIGYCEGERTYLSQALNKNQKNVQLFIGPEGDFSESEIEMALKQSIKPISLGDSRLRTETAALAGIIQLQTILNYV